MSRVDGKRGEHRKYPVPEDAGDITAVGFIELIGAHQANPSVLEPGGDLLVDQGGRPSDDCLHPGADGEQLFGRGQPVR